ncbi:MAG: hypothetical protein E6H09_07800 [Bacteroidetes bacterium]|jgi:hypothetical protein|nr:MAG: hypothetical protein E6H09_07800 [Bacteroidota bacterium]
MKEIILLKGYPNTGKSLTLKNELPPLMGEDAGKRTFRYKGKLIWIIRRSLHESYDWKEVLKKINKSNHDIIVLPAWADDWINYSKYINRTVESLIRTYIPSRTIAGTVFTISETNEPRQRRDQRRCAREILDLIETLVTI